MLSASFVLAALTLLNGCDRRFDPDIDLADLQDLDEDDVDGIWARGLDVGDFLYEETSVYHWGDCTTTKTIELEGNGGCSVGLLGVGIEESDGHRVTGSISLCGTLTWTETQSSSFCGENTSGTIENGVAQLVFDAPAADDPMEMYVPADDPDLEISTIVFAATAIEERGTAETVRLDGSATSEDGLQSKTVSVVADFVVM